MNNVWIVEMLLDGKWLPTEGMALTREEIRYKIKRWKDSNPKDKFRIRKYMSLENVLRRMTNG